ncbi:MAG: 50S ribosomal protein L6 [Candidatus Woesearchaeota archaeon]
MKLDLTEQIEIPEGVEVKIDSGLISAKGPKGEISRRLAYPKVSVDVKDNKLTISSKKATKREKRIIFTFKSHLVNMIQGVTEGHSYKLKVCSTHFPMTVAIENGEFVVQNFLGEKIPRKCKIQKDAEVKIEGQDIMVESVDKEAAGQTAASIEQVCRITKRDRRIFQDGIYIITKSKKILKNE